MRKTSCAQVSSETQEMMIERLRGLEPKLEVHYQTPLRGLQPPQFLIYGVGDFYGRHSDWYAGDGAPAHMRDRRISVVIFLNDESPARQPDSYDGGSLIIYGVLDDPKFKDIGFRFVGETGKLIAFPSDRLHEVEPVTRGQRHSIVSWFF